MLITLLAEKQSTEASVQIVDQHPLIVSQWLQAYHLARSVDYILARARKTHLSMSGLPGFVISGQREEYEIPETFDWRPVRYNAALKKVHVAGFFISQNGEFV